MQSDTVFCSCPYQTVSMAGNYSATLLPGVFQAVSILPIITRPGCGYAALMENPSGFPQGLGQVCDLPTYPRAAANRKDFFSFFAGKDKARILTLPARQDRIIYIIAAPARPFFFPPSRRHVP
jgi:hypothetical protein